MRLNGSPPPRLAAVTRGGGAVAVRGLGLTLSGRGVSLCTPLRLL